MLMPTKDDLITCPYDKVHRISLSRFQVHLVKCKQNYPDTKLKECPMNSTHKVWEPELNKLEVNGIGSQFQVNSNKNKLNYPDAKLIECPLNSTHIILESQLSFHLEYVCEDRGKIDNFVSFNTDEVENIIEPPKVEIFEDGGENWDDEDHPTYDPEKHCLNNPVIIIKNGLKPSKRKEHRQKQRQKLRDFKTGASQANDSKFNELSSASNASSSGMRLPTTKPKTIEGFENVDSANSKINLSNLSISDKKNTGGAFIKPKIISGRGRGRLVDQQ